MAAQDTKDNLALMNGIKKRYMQSRSSYEHVIDYSMDTVVAALQDLACAQCLDLRRESWPSQR